MTRPTRIVDAHVHFWDPARTDWYPYLSGGQDIGMGDVRGMARRFDAATYRAEAPGWNVERFVNVAAATGRHSVEETVELDRLGVADAFVGGLPPTETVAEAVALLDRQAEAPGFRGVRPMGRTVGPLPPPEVLAELAARELVFDLMAHPDQLVAAARGLAAHPGLTVVVEHTGWPRADTAEERTLWLDGLAALADLGERVACKLSGLAMPLGSMAPAALAPWLEPAIERFGAGRCLFASNFPVDGLHGSLDELWSAYDAVTGGLPTADRDLLFAGTAERIYRLS